MSDIGRQIEERADTFCKMAEREIEARTDRYEGLVKQNVDSQVCRKGQKHEEKRSDR